MYCQKCGAINDDNAQFCINCGSQLNAGTSQGFGPNANMGQPSSNMGQYQNPGQYSNMGQYPNMGQNPGSQSGAQKNVSALLCYVLGWITGIIFLVIEKDRFVRFHAMQSIFAFGGLTIVSIVISVLRSLLWRVGLVFSLVSTLISILSLVIWILMMIKAYQGQWYKLPLVGDMAEKYVK